MIKRQEYHPIGMRQDNLIGTGYSTKYADEIMNLRFVTVGDATTSVWTVERGTVEEPIYWANKEIGTNNTVIVYQKDTLTSPITFGIKDFGPIGQAVINDKWILFGKDNSSVGMKDIIFQLEYQNIKGDITGASGIVKDGRYLIGTLLYSGFLDFSTAFPIETLVSYETDTIQKVYWTDNRNQPRMINICNVRSVTGSNTQFDFAQTVVLDEDISIKKIKGNNGSFPPGTVQYAFTYYNIHGQETNIVWTSSLFYPTMEKNRACSPDEVSTDSFQIDITNVDTTHHFDYIRLYSIIRTTEGATPIVRRIGDKEIKSSITFVDTNTTGETIDPSLLYYIGSKDIKVKTMTQKDGVMFLGNISLKQKSVTETLNNYNNLNPQDIISFKSDVYSNISFKKNGKTYIVNDNFEGYYPYRTQLDDYYSRMIKNFKWGETYRFGIQFQDTKGTWSEVVYLKDITNEEPPEYNPNFTAVDSKLCKTSVVEYVLPNKLKKVLYLNGYRKARLVCCYPSNSDRTVLAQGVLCPTVYNYKENKDNAPTAMASWFYRPVRSKNYYGHHGIPNFSNPLISGVGVLGERWYGGFTEWRGEHRLPRNTDANAEIQSSEGRVLTFKEESVGDKHTVSRPLSIDDADNDSDYFISPSIFTFNSPEIEYDESIRTLDIGSTCKIRLVGKIPINASSQKVYINADTPASTYMGHKGRGLIKDYSSMTCIMDYIDIYDNTLGMWNDTDKYYWRKGNFYSTDYPIYPFQRKGPLNNYMKDIKDFEITYQDEDGKTKTDKVNIGQTGVLHSKVMARMLTSYQTYYYKDSLMVTASDQRIDLGVKTMDIFDSKEVLPIRLSGSHIYYGNVNTIVPQDSVGYIAPDGNILAKPYDVYDADYKLYPCTGNYYLHRWVWSNASTFGTGGTYAKSYSGVTSDPISITYRSTPHLVFDRKESSMSTDESKTLFGLNDLNNEEYSYLWIAELYRPTVTNRFGGSGYDENVLRNNKFIPCGQAYNLYEPNDPFLNNTSDITMIGDEGDSYYMRYDSLKTCPYTVEDTNQIVEILSFMVESRINLDGRYDKNRGLIDNTLITDSNFGYINPSYTQSNSTFSFRSLEAEWAKLSHFPNQITWTLNQVAGNDVDQWTLQSLVSTADADGSLGSINKIVNFNGGLFMFQDHGISQIGYNDRVALSTDSGTPVEIGKSAKFTGFNYISKEVGCQNKGSICNTGNGIYFIDDSRTELNRISNGITPLSTTHGLSSFLMKTLKGVTDEWTPRTFNNFVSYYDKITKDVYYQTKDVCLSYNENTGTFTSFYSYNNSPLMAIIDNKSMIVHDGIWKAREGAYSTFFGIVKPYWITLCCDGFISDGNTFDADKVFNTVEFRGDAFDMDETIPRVAISTPLFNKVSAYNGYQCYKEFNINNGIGSLNYDPLYQWKAERKFNVWRVILPRASYMDAQGNIFTNKDRIRNTFSYVKLLEDFTDNTVPIRAVLHDFSITFDIK